MRRDELRRVAERHKRLIIQPFDIIMEQEGFEAICTIADLLGGKAMYMPSKRTIFFSCIQAAAREELATGMTHKQLGLKYGYTERHMRRMVSE